MAKVPIPAKIAKAVRLESRHYFGGVAWYVRVHAGKRSMVVAETGGYTTKEAAAEDTKIVRGLLAELFMEASHATD
jgi:hypothetical protein